MSPMSPDLEKLQGSWSITALEIDAQRMPEAVFVGARIVLKGSQFTSEGVDAKYQGIVELDATKKPKQFDLVFTQGPEKGNRNLGIYKLEGETWTLCLATGGNRRPKKFATEPGSGVALQTLTREKSKGKATKSRASHQTDAAITAETPQPAVAGSPTELEGEWAMLSAIFDGAPMDPAAVKWCKRITRGQSTKVVAGPQVFLDATFTLDRSTNPNSIDYLNVSGPSKGKKQLGIFELRDGELSICIAPPGKARPIDFASKRRDGRSYTTWRQLKK